MYFFFKIYPLIYISRQIMSKVLKSLPPPIIFLLSTKVLITKYKWNKQPNAPATLITFTAGGLIISS